MARKIRTEDILGERAKERIKARHEKRARERELRKKRLAAEEASSRAEAERTPHKGTPPQSYLEARDRLMGVKQKREKRPWNFANHMTMTDPEHWVTYDGRRIPVSMMEDSHVVNTVKLLRRTASRAKLAEAFSMLAGPRPSGDMASLAFEQGLEELAMMSNDQFLYHFCPPFRALMARHDECLRRMEEEERAWLDEALFDPWGNS
jgi:hypothetical protein